MNNSMILRLLVCLLFLCSCKNEIYKYHDFRLGTVINITIIDSQNKADAAANAAFAEITRIESLMSPVSVSGDVYKINHTVPGTFVDVSEDTFTVIKQAIETSYLTNGAFDITFASMNNLWDFSKNPFAPPQKFNVDYYKKFVNFRYLYIDSKTSRIQITNYNTKIGLGGIAKGYAIKSAVEILRQRGINNAIVDAGGDLQVIGNKLGSEWQVGLRDPRETKILLSIKMKDKEAVATSGDYERFAIVNGVRYHHIIDPSTGYPADKFASVSVFANDAVTADAFATAFFILGKDRSAKIAKEQKLLFIFIDLNMNIYASEDMRNRIAMLEEKTVEWIK